MRPPACVRATRLASWGAWGAAAALVCLAAGLGCREGSPQTPPNSPLPTLERTEEPPGTPSPSEEGDGDALDAGASLVEPSSHLRKNKENQS